METAPTEVASLRVAETQTATTDIRALDAGSSRRSAADLGPIAGQRTLRGTLGWGDSRDVVRFEIAQSSEVRFALTDMQRDADLRVLDARGNRIGESSQSGPADEVLSGNLPAGTYYFEIIGRSFWLNRYTLEVSVAENAPPPVIDRDSSTNPDDSNLVTPLVDVPDFGSSAQWNLNSVGAPEAWAAGYTGDGVTVAVIDTGVDLDHPDLVGQLFVNAGEIPGNGIDDDGNGFVDDVSGYDFVDNDTRPDDVGGHGTHVAGIVAANGNAIGATGVAPDAKILPVRVLGDDGSGSSFGVAAGIRYAADLGADIINLSLGGGFSGAIEAAIDYAASLGSLVVAAAGNESASVPSFPAQFSGSSANVISVGAYDSNHRIASFSNDVGRSGAVQVDAPGARVWSTYVGGGYAWLSGTSMAAPHVAGLAAITLSANPQLTSPELRDLLTGGTLGLASGSDSLGSADARTSVAYAAAGITSAGEFQPASNPVFADASRGSLVRATNSTVSRSPLQTDVRPIDVIATVAPIDTAATPVQQEVLAERSVEALPILAKGVETDLDPIDLIAVEQADAREASPASEGVQQRMSAGLPNSGE
ncbi:MAG: S8 family peptidase [Planctomycetota bacterium]